MLFDLSEIRRRSEEHATEDLAFRRYLHDHHVPDQALREHTAELLAQFDCRQCANCCKETRVPATEEEIEAIAADLKLTPWEVRHIYAERGDRVDEVLIRQNDGACVFLDGGECIVYQARPGPCKQFPAIALHADLLGNRMASVCKQAAICPVVYEALEKFKTTTGFKTRKDHDQAGVPVSPLLWPSPNDSVALRTAGA